MCRMIGRKMLYALQAEDEEALSEFGGKIQHQCGQHKV